MRCWGSLVTFCLVGVMLSSSWSASAAITATTLGNTPWPMFRHDLLHTGRSPNLGAQSFALKWSFDTGGDGIDSSPAIDANGNVYVQSRNKVGFVGGGLFALHPDGTLKWRFQTNDAFPGCCIGLESSPAIDSNGNIYVGSSDGFLYSIFSDGTLRWKFPTGGPIQSSPTIGTDGTIYVGSNDGNLYAINQNGLLKWKFLTGGSVTSSPAIDSKGVIYVGSSDTNLYAIDPSTSTSMPECVLKTGGGIRSSPAIREDDNTGRGGGRIYIVSTDDNLYAMNRNCGMVSGFPFKLSPVTLGSCGGDSASPAIGHNGIVFVGTFCGPFDAVNPDGTLAWSVSCGTETFSSAAIGSDGTIYYGTDDPPCFPVFNTVLALNPQDGTLKWGSGFRGFIFNSSAAIASDGTIYIGTEPGTLLAIS